MRLDEESPNGLRQHLIEAFRRLPTVKQIELINIAVKMVKESGTQKRG